MKSVIQNDKIGGEELALLKAISQISSILSVLLEETGRLENYRKRFTHSNILYKFKSTSTDERTNNSMVFNIVTQDTMSTSTRASKSYRGHRLPKENVGKLERWFADNINRPYLDEGTLKSLMAETSLSRLQIKNWVSNRRRKEKSLTISVSITDLLAEDKARSKIET